MMKLQAKRFKLNFLLKLSDLKSNFALNLGYLYPTLNNSSQVNESIGLYVCSSDGRPVHQFFFTCWCACLTVWEIIGKIGIFL